MNFLRIEIREMKGILVFSRRFRSQTAVVQRVDSTRGGSSERVQGVHTPPKTTCYFLIQLLFCKKKNCVVYWFTPSLKKSWICP